MKRVGLLLALGWLASVCSGGPVFAVGRLKVGEPLPAFTLPRADVTGAEFKSEQLGGKPAALLFWRPNQKLSLEALRDLRAVAEELGIGKVRVAAVDSSRSPAREIRAALSAESFSFPLLLDPQRSLYGQVGVIVTPTTLLLDAQGVLRYVLPSRPRYFHQVLGARLRYLLGEISEEEMNQEIEPTVLKIDHKVAAAWRMYNLGKKLQAEGKTQQAISLYEKAVSQHPSLAEARCALGLLKLSQADLEGAAQHFRTALAHQPTSALARLGIAAVLARSGEDQQAEPLLLSLLGQRSIAVRVRYELGRIYNARGEVQKAVTFYEDALAGIFPEAGRGAELATPPAIASGPLAVAAPSSRPAAAPKVADTPKPSAARRGAERPTVTPVVPRSDAKYIGLKRCKKCHYQQWKSWEQTRMAKAFELLKPNVRDDVKLMRGLDPKKDYTADPVCLGCHTTGYGRPGGYPSSPPADARARSAARELAGVGCEACHAPGSTYAQIHKEIQDKKRPYTQQELFEVGQYELGEPVCAACHNWKGPCIDPESAFDYAKRKEEGTHKHYELQFRSQ